MCETENLDVKATFLRNGDKLNSITLDVRKDFSTSEPEPVRIGFNASLI